MQHPYLDAPTPKIFAHRGFVAPGSPYVENTQAAFDAAADLGVTYIETDCRLTASGDVVLFHDDTADRVASCPAVINQISTDTLRELMDPLGGVLTVPEALARYPHIRFNIDCKTAEAAERLGKIASTQGHRMLVTSFSDTTRATALASAQAAGPGMTRPATSPGQNRLIALLAGAHQPLGKIRARAFAGLDCLQIPEKQGPVPVVTPHLIRAAHAHGVEVHVWTVNDPADMRRLVGMGVDGIITDRTDLAIKHLGMAQ